MTITRQFKPYPRGLTLIELMIAIVVSSILMLGIVQVFSLNKRIYGAQDDAARMQESGRYAFNLLMQDLRRAGYYGGNANIDDITGTSGLVTPANTCTANNTWARMLQRPVIGLDDTNAGYTGCIPDADYTQGDILVTRYTSGLPTTTFDNNRVYVRSSMFEGRLFLGSAEADASNQVSEIPNAAFELLANAYYVGPSDQTCRFNDSAGNAIPVPALWREVLDASATPVAEVVANGIEHLQIQYGIDTDDDIAVNQYFDADAISNDTTVTPNWSQVVAVRLWVLARAECPTADYTNTNTYTMGDITYDPDPDDSFKRQLYSTTVALRN